MALAASLALTGLSVSVQAEIAGPLPLVVATYVGVLTEGEMDSVTCTMTSCPKDPVCILEEVDIRATLRIFGSPENRVTLAARSQPGEGMVADTAEGLAGVAEVVAHQGDDCLEVWVFGSSVEEYAAYLLKIEYLTGEPAG